MTIEEIRTPEDILTFMNEHIKYGWIDINNEEHIGNMKGFRKLYRTSTIEETLEHKIGTCVEQVYLMHYLLEKINIPSKMFCTRIYEGKDFNNLEAEEHMHCFILYYLNGKVYQIEHPNWERIGIYEFQTEEEAINTINDYYVKMAEGKSRPVTRYYEVKPKLSFKEFNEYINSLDKRLYLLFSGTDKKEGFYNSQKEILQNKIKNDKIITFISSSFDNPETNDLYYENMIKFFKDINITFKETHLIDNRLSKEKAKEYIYNSDIIYIMGGIPSQEMESIRKYDLIDTIKNFNGIIITVSAGSINMNKHICYEDEGKIVEYEGIGLLDYNLAPHYDNEKQDYIEEIKRVSMKTKTLALPNESFIVFENNESKIIGEYLYFENGNKM